MRSRTRAPRSSAKIAGALHRSLKQLPTLAPGELRDAGARIQRRQGEAREPRSTTRAAAARARRARASATSTSRCPRAANGAAPSIRSRSSSKRSRRSSASSASPSRSVPRPRRSGTTSARSTFRPIIRRWTCTTRSTSSDGGLLRTHTSPVQIRTLQSYPPPIRMLAPGNVYRRDFFDASHAPMFAQIEGLAVDEGISFVDLKATLDALRQSILRRDEDALSSELLPVHRAVGRDGRRVPALRRQRLRHAARAPGGSRSSARGMVHPAVLEAAGVDSERYTGWAFGMGPARIAHAALRHSRHPHSLRLRHRASSSSSRMNASYEWLRALVPLRPVRRQSCAICITARCRDGRRARSRCATISPTSSSGASSKQRRIRTPTTCWVTKVDAGRATLLDVVCGAPNVQRRRAVSVRAGRDDAPGRAQDREAKDPRRDLRTACCAPRASSGSGRTTTASWSLTIDAAPGTPFLDAMPDRRHAARGRCRCRIVPTCSRTWDSRARSPRRPVERVSCPRSRMRGRSSSARIRRGDDRRRRRRHRAARGHRRLRPRFAGVVIRGVNVGPSPDWLVERLEAVGRGSINNVVDVTNYMLHEIGQPMHAFDLAKLGGSTVVVRRARRARRITTLDGVDRTLDPGMIVIADARAGAGDRRRHGRQRRAK